MIFDVSETSCPERRAAWERPFETTEEVIEKAYEPNEQASKYVETSVLLYANFEEYVQKKLKKSLEIANPTAGTAESVLRKLMHASKKT